MQGIIISLVCCLLVRLILLVLFQDWMSGLRVMKESDLPLNLHLSPLSTGGGHRIHFESCTVVGNIARLGRAQSATEVSFCPVKRGVLWRLEILE